MRKAIYTCIVGGYDYLEQPAIIDPSFDYICFKDKVTEDHNGVWKIRKIPFEHPDNTRKSRFVKILPQEVLQEYDYSVWLDSNLQIRKKEFYDYINKRIKEDQLICQVKHNANDCIYQDMRLAYYIGKVSFFAARRQYKHLKSEGFPSHYGLFDNNIIFRKHNDSTVKKISQAWWNEYMSYSKRDQFCLMYIYWKNDFMPEELFSPGMNVRESTIVGIRPHILKLHRRSNKPLDVLNAKFKILYHLFERIFLTNYFRS